MLIDPNINNNPTIVQKASPILSPSMNSIVVLSIVSLAHRLYVALETIRNSLALLVVRRNTESIDSKL